MANDLRFVAFDIETTGFEIDDQVTVFGIKQPLGCRVFCREPDDGAVTPGTIETTVEDRAETNVIVSVHDTEPELLAAVGEFAAARLQDNDVLLVAFNGEQYRSGFDLPFLRSRLVRTNGSWPFGGLPYADLMPVLTYRFNTTLDGEARSDLVGVYNLLCDGELSAIDPFDASKEAVTAFNEGRIEDVVLHNIADILRTDALGELAQRYCSKSDFNLKSLTPTNDD